MYIRFSFITSSLSPPQMTVVCAVPWHFKAATYSCVPSKTDPNTNSLNLSELHAMEERATSDFLYIRWKVFNFLFLSLTYWAFSVAVLDGDNARENAYTSENRARAISFAIQSYLFTSIKLLYMRCRIEVFNKWLCSVLCYYTRQNVSTIHQVTNKTQREIHILMHFNTKS